VLENSVKLTSITIVYATGLAIQRCRLKSPQGQDFQYFLIHHKFKNCHSQVSSPAAVNWRITCAVLFLF
jgi:hypothetical protein